MQHNQPVNGEFRRAKIYTEDFHRYTLGMQNHDGSFSTEWFVSPGNRSEYRSPIANDRPHPRVAGILSARGSIEEPADDESRELFVGHLAGPAGSRLEHRATGHALHALAIYDERLFKAAEQAAVAPLGG